MGELVLLKNGHPSDHYDEVLDNPVERSANNVAQELSLVGCSVINFLQEVLPCKYRLGEFGEDEYSGENFVFFRKKKFNLPLGWLSTRGREDYIELWVFRSAKSIIEEIVSILEIYSRNFGNVTLNICENY
jgi:hypothetical protein